MDNLNVEITKEELMAIIGALVKINASFGVIDEQLNALIDKMQNIAIENITREEMAEMLLKHL